MRTRQINAGTLALYVARSGTKLSGETASLSAGGSEMPAYDVVWFAQLLFGENELAKPEVR